MTTDFILYLSAVVTAFGVLFGAIYGIYRIADRIGKAVGVDREGRTVSERLERVEYQLWENGGSSLADRVNNIEMHVVKVSAEVELIKDITLGLHNSVTAPTETLPEKKTRRKAS